jgi:basic membrane lipoprotein Med (substrate-binding protein (PBP1-ABC) superfamily)
MKVGLLTPGSINDRGWNAIAYEGLLRIQKELGASIVAARESKTGKAGVVGGIKLPSIASTFLAFRAGAQSINPKFEVKEIYTGNFDDISAVKLATLSLINAGCDFIFHQANEAGRGVFQAYSERKVRYMAHRSRPSVSAALAGQERRNRFHGVE